MFIIYVFVFVLNVFNKKNDRINLKSVEYFFLWIVIIFVINKVKYG